VPGLRPSRYPLSTFFSLFPSIQIDSDRSNTIASLGQISRYIFQSNLYHSFIIALLNLDLTNDCSMLKGRGITLCPRSSEAVYWESPNLPLTKCPFTLWVLMTHKKLTSTFLRPLAFTMLSWTTNRASQRVVHAILQQFGSYSVEEP
jgi:hypothetical protein